jgi:hypothetical protein
MPLRVVVDCFAGDCAVSFAYTSFCGLYYKVTEVDEIVGLEVESSSGVFELACLVHDSFIHVSDGDQESFCA